MIPNNKWVCNTDIEALDLKGLSVPSGHFGSLFDIKLGPQELNDSEGRLDEAVWLMSYEDGAFYLRKAVSGEWQTRQFVVVPQSIPDTFSFSFDAVGSPLIAYSTGSLITLWFYFSQSATYIFKEISTEGRTPLIEFDRRDDTSNLLSDVLLFYVEKDTIWERRSRDNYNVAYNTGTTQLGIKLDRIGRTVNNRLQIEYSYKKRNDGANAVKKVLTAQSSFLRNMFLNEFEVSFTIAKAPTACDLSFLHAALGQNFCCVVQHSGYFYDADSNQERLFSLELLPEHFTNPTSTDTILLLRGGNPSDSYYHTQTVPLTTFSIGNFVLRFTQAPDEPIVGTKRKRIEFIKDGIVIFDVTVNDENSLTIPSQSANDTLRFGAEYRGGGYMNYFPAVFTNIKVKVNGVETVWDKKYSDKFTQSQPNGNPLQLLEDGDSGVIFY